MVCVLGHNIRQGNINQQYIVSNFQVSGNKPQINLNYDRVSFGKNTDQEKVDKTCLKKLWKDLERNAISFTEYIKLGKLLSEKWDNLPKGNMIKFKDPDKNFLKVNKWLYRGPQPGEKGIKELKKQGIRVIINLKQDKNSKLEKYEKEASDQGIKYHNVPFNHFADYALGDCEKLKKHSEKNIKKVKEIFKIIDGSVKKKKPVYIHCRHGEDRTGMIVAVYRVKKQGWPAEKAIEEWKSLGYRYQNYQGLMNIFNRAIQDETI